MDDDQALIKALSDDFEEQAHKASDIQLSGQVSRRIKKKQSIRQFKVVASMTFLLLMFAVFGWQPLINALGSYQAGTLDISVVVLVSVLGFCSFIIASD